MGATGINRIEAPNFYPYTIAILNMDRDVDTPNWAVGDGFPGEYAFVSGVGPQPPSLRRWRCGCRRILPPHYIEICDSGEIDPRPCCPRDTAQEYCMPIYRPRPLRIGIIDLNPQILNQLPFSTANLVENANYQRYIGGFDPGAGGFKLGTSDHGLDFYSSSDGTNATVYAVSPNEDSLYYFDFLSAVNNPSSISASSVQLSCLDGNGNAAQCYPTDVKVQTLAGVPFAFVTNSYNDSVTSLQIAPSTTPGEPSTPNYSSTFMENSCSAVPIQHFPVSIDTRLKGADTWGYCADYGSTTVTAFNFSQNACQGIPVGLAPFRVVVQPVPTAQQAFQAVKDEMVYALPADFTQPAQQIPLISEWENVQHLQETQASPQAVLSNIDNFQRHVENWVVSGTLQTNINAGVDVYRAVYLQENALPGNP